MFPQRIVSLVPSQTELLYYLGLRDEVIAITKFCVHPEIWFRNKNRIGGTKNLSIEKIKSLNPDLILANKEENVKEQIEELKKYFPVWTSDIKNLDDALTMIGRVGELINKKVQSEKIIQEINFAFQHLSILTVKRKPQTVSYLIWQKPFMTIGKDTFINDMLAKCGFKNVFNSLTRYPEITADEIKNAQPDFIFLSSEPFPFKVKHIKELQIVSPASKIILVNGEFFSWYGSRMIKAADYFEKLIKEIDSVVHL
jgi:ABC-type Fe3+-hydroxamate transport system substrate-binding protein